MIVERYAGRRGKARQVILAEGNGQIAALRDGNGIGKCLRQVGELCRHLRLCHEILLRREATRAPRIGERVSFRDAHACLVRTKVPCGQELDRMRGDDRRSHLIGKGNRRLDQRFIVGVSGPLHFEYVSLRKTREPLAREPLRRRDIALEQRLANIAVARTGQCDQAIGTFVEPGTAELCAAAMLMRAIGLAQPAAEPQVAFAGGSEQQHARRLVALAVVGDPDIATGDRLDATRAGSRIELDEAELIGEIGECERRHTVRCCCGDGVIDAQRAVRDRKFAMQTQMDEAGR